MYYRQRVEKKDWEHLSKQFKKHVGFYPIKYEWEGCVGCVTPTEQLPKHPHYNFLKSCNTRKCVNYNEIDSCAHCSRYPCGNTVSLQGLTREKLSTKLDEEISDENYRQFIRMFDSMTNLTDIRQSLSKNQLHDPKPIGKSTLTKDISDRIKDEELKQFYSTLMEIHASDLGIQDTDTLAGFEKLKIRQEVISRILWLVGIQGERDSEGIILDGITLHKNKKTAKLPTSEKGWEIYLETLTGFGIKSILDIKTKFLYTPGGWMRDRIPKSNKPAYYLKMSLDPKLIKIAFFKILKSYIADLQATSGRRGYTKFKYLNTNFFFK
jgi:hypothetical protein